MGVPSIDGASTVVFLTPNGVRHRAQRRRAQVDCATGSASRPRGADREGRNAVFTGYCTMVLTKRFKRRKAILVRSRQKRSLFGKHAIQTQLVGDLRFERDTTDGAATDQVYFGVLALFVGVPSTRVTICGQNSEDVLLEAVVWGGPPWPFHL